jgi:hypothetical protein
VASDRGRERGASLARASRERPFAAVLTELAQIESVDVVLPTTDAGELRVRCVVKPEQPQALLLERLGLKLPRRLSNDRSPVAASV